MSAESFECGVCLEKVQEGRNRVRAIGNDFVCSKCAPDIIPLFEAALKSEVNFPPKWGPCEINFAVFSDLFTHDFRLRWYAKVYEYKTPIPERVYCQHKVPAAEGDSGRTGALDTCNAFVGISKPRARDQCRACKGWMCMECRGATFPVLEKHICDKTKADSETEVLDPATRGKEWQACPNPACKIKCGLRDGCNAIMCICGCSFCYICGEKAGHDSGHWSEGKPCPRWGEPDAKNPMFDPPQRVNPEFIEPPPGNFIVMVQVEDAVIHVEVGESLYMDNREALTLVLEFEAEMHMLVEDDEPIPKVILEMEDLLNDLRENLLWLVANMAFDTRGFGLFRGMLVDPVVEAVQATNFFIRDEKLKARLRETHVAALQLTGPHTALLSVPVFELFERYLHEHKPVYEESLRRFQFFQDGGRAAWMQMRGEDWQRRRRASQ